MGVIVSNRRLRITGQGRKVYVNAPVSITGTGAGSSAPPINLAFGGVGTIAAEVLSSKGNGRYWFGAGQDADDDALAGTYTKTGATVVYDTEQPADGQWVYLDEYYSEAEDTTYPGVFVVRVEGVWTTTGPDAIRFWGLGGSTLFVDAPAGETTTISVEQLTGHEVVQVIIGASPPHADDEEPARATVIYPVATEFTGDMHPVLRFVTAGDENFRTSFGASAGSLVQLPAILGDVGSVDATGPSGVDETYTFTVNGTTTDVLVPAGSTGDDALGIIAGALGSDVTVLAPYWDPVSNNQWPFTMGTVATGAAATLSYDGSDGADQLGLGAVLHGRNGRAWYLGFNGNYGTGELNGAGETHTAFDNFVGVGTELQVLGGRWAATLVPNRAQFTQYAYRHTTEPRVITHGTVDGALGDLEDAVLVLQEEGGGSGPDLSDATPAVLGTAASGSSGDASRADHVHAKPTPADIGALDASSGFNTANGWLKLDGDGTAPDNRIPSSIARDSEVDTKIATHSAATDPHGDRAYAASLFASNDAMVFKGVIDCSTNPNYPAADAGHTYKVSVAGRIGGGSGAKVEAGELLLCTVDSTASGTHAAVGANWTIGQVNIDGAVVGPTSVTDATVALFDGTSGKLLKAGGTLGTAAFTASSAYDASGAATAAGAAIPSGGTAGTPALRALGTSGTTAAAGNDSRLSDARTPTAHKSSHAAGGADALVSADLPSVLIARLAYLPGSDNPLTVTSPTLVDVDATNLVIPNFTAPASGIVDVSVEAWTQGSASNILGFGLRQGSTDLTSILRVNAVGILRQRFTFRLTGLSGTVSGIKLAYARVTGSSTTATFVGPTYGPLLMEVRAG